jgi:hypothetical protein
MPNLKKFKIDQGMDVNGVITATSISATTIDATLTGAALDNPTFTGTVTIPTLNVGQGGFNAPNFGDVTSDEIQQLDGVTSNIQTQLDAKASKTYVDDAIAAIPPGGGDIDLTPYATTSYVDQEIANVTVGDINLENPTFDIHEEMPYGSWSAPQGWSSIAIYDDTNYGSDYLSLILVNPHPILKNLAGVLSNSGTMLNGLPNYFAKKIQFSQGVSSIGLPSGSYQIVDAKINGPIKPSGGPVPSYPQDVLVVHLYIDQNILPSNTYIMNSGINFINIIPKYQDALIGPKELAALKDVTGNIQAQIDASVGIDLTPYVTKTNPEFLVTEAQDAEYTSPFHFSSLTAFHHPDMAGDPSTLGIVINSASMDIQMLNITDPTKYKFRLNSTINVGGAALSPGDYPLESLRYPTTYTDGDGITHGNATVAYIDTDNIYPVSYLTTEVTWINSFTIVPIIKTISEKEISYLDGLTGNIQSQINDKPSFATISSTVQGEISSIGSWNSYTPSLSIYNDTINIGSHGFVSGRYTKIGNTVHYEVNLVVTGTDKNLGNGSNPLSIGLPTPASQVPTTVGSCSGTVNSRAIICGFYGVDLDTNNGVVSPQLILPDLSIKSFGNTDPYDLLTTPYLTMTIFGTYEAS